MRVLVTWGSKRGGTEGIARTIGETLRSEGYDVELLPARRASKASGFDAVIVGGALYAFLWHADARRFVSRRANELRRVPVWFFSSGPLDDSADRQEIAPVRQVKLLMERVGALGHVTFGGRLSPDAKGVPEAMRRQHSGDFRNEARIRAWSQQIARALPKAKPGDVVAQAGGSIGRLVAHAVTGWAACALIMGALLRVASTSVAVVVHAFAVPLVFAAVAHHYFSRAAPGARAPLPTGAAFAGIVALLDAAVIAPLLQHGFAMFASIAGTWLPFALIFLVTWGVGTLMLVIPPNAPRARPRAA